jgi:ABC-type lipoprotein release transport system permease subunit
MRNESYWYADADGPMPPIAYIPIAQLSEPYAWSPVIVHATPGAAPIKAIAAQVHQLNPDIAVDFLHMKAEVRQRLAGERMTAWLAGAFGVLAMLLVTIGLHGLIAYLTVSRTSEIGIRLSLGSTRTQIVNLVLRDSARMIAIGVAIGVPLALLAMRAARALLFGLSATDVPTVAAAAIALAAVATAAGAVPAWRASRLDPAIVLRTD